MSNTITITLLLLCLCISGIAGYTVSGNKIIDPNGKQVLIRGVDRPSFEWNINGESANANDYALMRQWGSNMVRISLNQDFWLGSSASTYRGNIDQQIAWATATGMGIMLDLHWNGGGQQNMADRTSITFWADVAAKYKNNKWIMFELYNEPHDVTWAQWLNGDSKYAGMQEMYNAIRAAGAENTVVVCGLNWAFDLSGVSTGYALTGTNIAYATHPYDYPGKQMGDWPAAFGNLAKTSPVIMTEFGQYCATNTYVADLLAYCQTNGIHWTAWAWYVNGCSFPSIISDWQGTPSPIVGVLVKQYLSGNAPSAPVLPTSQPSTPSTPSTPAPSGPASSSMSIYSDSLASGWQDWSWATSYSLSDGTYARTGTKSIKFNVQKYGGIYLHYTSSFALSGYASLQFYVNGGPSAVSASSLSVKLYGTTSNVVGNTVNFPASVPASQWSLITIPITGFGVPGTTQISGLVIQSNADASAGTIWIDDISFAPAASSSTSSPTQAPTKAPTSAPTSAPTAAATKAPTSSPTSAPTAAATKAPTSAPTSAPTAAATKAPTSAPTAAATKAPTSAPSSGGCSASNVQITQTAGGSWAGTGGTVTQYDVKISNTCAGKTLVGLTLTATNWNPVNFWNAQISTVGGTTTITLPAYAAITASSPFSLGYQNTGGQATFTVTSATFQ